MQQSSPYSDQWFEAFVTETRRELAGFVRRFVRSADDVQGILQETYLKVFCTLRRDRDGGHAPIPLLYTTARNVALSRLRHQRVIEQSCPSVQLSEELRREADDAESEAASGQRRVTLFKVINALPPKCRRVIQLRMISGMSQREIAEQLGIAESTVEKHLAKGLRHCREAFARRRAERPDAAFDVPGLLAGRERS
ncbi:MAG: RNA polymerase sigma factor [Pseudomonadota bacterium]